MLPQGAIQLYLSVIGTREETVFLLRIISHQMFCETTNVSRQVLRNICEEIMRGEHKRETLEEQAIIHLGEGIRRFIPKLTQKVCKVAAYYANKTQVYFPRYGLVLAQDQMTYNQNLKSSVSILNNDPNYTTQMILRYISNQQKQKLKHELMRLHSYTPQIQQLFERSDRCNRNEKLFSDPLMVGLNGVRYMNDIHHRYFLQSRPRSTKAVYDIMPLDDQSRQLLYSGPGFKCFISSVCQIRQDKSADSIYVPLEATQEIITQRYEKFFKEMQECNSHVAKGLQRYAEQYNKFILRRNSKQQKNASRSSFQQKSIKINHSQVVMRSEPDEQETPVSKQTNTVVLEKIKERIKNNNEKIPLPLPEQPLNQPQREQSRDITSSQRRLIRIKQMPISTQSSQILQSVQQFNSVSGSEPPKKDYITQKQLTTPKILTPYPEEANSQSGNSRIGMSRLSIVTLPLNKQESLQKAQKVRKLRYAQASYEYEHPAIVNGFRLKVGGIQVIQSHQWSNYAVKQRSSLQQK